MAKYLEGKEQKEYNLSPNLVEAQYNPYNGLIVTTDSPMGKYIGYYTEDNMPAMGGYYDYNADNSSYSYDNSGGESGGGETGGGENSGGENSGGESSEGENSGGESSGGESSGGEHSGESSTPEGGGGEGSDTPEPAPAE